MKLRDLLLIAQQELFDLDNTIKDMRLEQAVFNQKENLWEVVISYLVDNKNKIIKGFYIYQKSS